MKMTLNEVEIHLKALSGLGNHILPIQLSYAISTNIKRFSELFSLAETERIKVCERYADKDKNNRPIKTTIESNEKKVEVFKISNERMVDLAKEICELKSTEIDVDIQTVNVSILEFCEKDSRYTMLSLSDIENLSFMLEI